MTVQVQVSVNLAFPAEAAMDFERPHYQSPVILRISSPRFCELWDANHSKASKCFKGLFMSFQSARGLVSIFIRYSQRLEEVYLIPLYYAMLSLAFRSVNPISVSPETCLAVQFSWHKKGVLVLLEVKIGIVLAASQSWAGNFARPTSRISESPNENGWGHDFLLLRDPMFDFAHWTGRFA